MTSIAIIGAAGRVGTRLIALVAGEPDRFRLTGKITRDNSGLGSPEVAIDFSSPEATRKWLPICREKKIPMLIATTGLSKNDHANIDDASRDIAILQATNTSLGVAILNRLVAETARALGSRGEIEIVEIHHNKKKDAPSGTALTLGQSTGRDVPMHSLRIGDEVGTHTVNIALPGERLELTHRALNRDVFASGALFAAEWLAKQKPGRYTMADALDLR